MLSPEHAENSSITTRDDGARAASEGAHAAMQSDVQNMLTPQLATDNVAANSATPRLELINGSTPEGHHGGCAGHGGGGHRGGWGLYNLYPETPVGPEFTRVSAQTNGGHAVFAADWAKTVGVQIGAFKPDGTLKY